MNLTQMIQRQQSILDTAKKAGRQLTKEENDELTSLQAQIDAARNVEHTEPDEGEETGSDTQRAIQNERQRITEIGNLCRSFGMDDSAYIANGTSVADVRTAIIASLQKTSESENSSLGSIRVGTTGAERMRAAATDGILLRAGFDIEKPCDGAEEFRNVSLQNIAMRCLSAEGKLNGRSAFSVSSDQMYDMLLRDFGNPSSSFASIMDNAARKAITESYKMAPTTFEKWTTSGTLRDFKQDEDHEYNLRADDLDEIPENGELKEGKISEAMMPTRKLKSYGKLFTMTRQAFINDDIGFISQIPSKYAIAAKRGIEKRCYEILNANPAIFDGVNLFDAENHKNLISSASKITTAEVEKLYNLARQQVDQFGDAIDVTIKYLIVPSHMYFDAQRVVKSQLIAENNLNGINVLAGERIEVISSARLKGNDWYMVADPITAKGIQVDYLNGNRRPEIKRGQIIGNTSMIWQIVFDYGVTPVDFRGLYKHVGV